MAGYEHLNNAPITEAVVDFRVRHAADLHFDKLEQVKQLLNDEYPESNMIRSGYFEFGFKEGQPIVVPPGEETILGYKLTSSDKTQVVQFRTNGFTFSRLKPYTRWEEILEEAKRLWQLYVKISVPESVTRIAARYINHMMVPLPIMDFKDYLTAPPIVPKDIPEELGAFLTRVSVHDRHSGLTANIVQSMEISVENNQVTLILDIDVYKQEEYKVDDERIWSEFTNIRDMKNKIFFNSITEKAKELFK